jgi:argininosuccinate synthase
MDAINAFNDKVNERVTGEVTVKLFKGNTTIVAVTSPFALDYVSFNDHEGYDLNVNISAGFIEVHSLQMKLANQIGKTKKHRTESLT